MNPLRIRAGYLLMLLSALCWLLGLQAGHVHALEVQHVQCAEHGERMEIGAEVERVEVAQISAPADHEHDCLLDGVVTWGAAASVPAISAPAVPALLGRWVPSDGAPRGPPLAYAPKTSPPHPS